MRQRSGRRRVACFAVASIAAVMLNLTGSPAQQRSGAVVTFAQGFPTDYRLVMAQYIRAHYRYEIRDARISLPYYKYMGESRDSTVAVCVAIYRYDPTGKIVRDTLILAVENGQVQELRRVLDECWNFSVFTELMQP
jgi:hypothetical protein